MRIAFPNPYFRAMFFLRLEFEPAIRERPDYETNGPKAAIVRCSEADSGTVLAIARSEGGRMV